MRCPQCGLELQRAGQGHTCRPAYPAAVRPPTNWVVTTWLAVGFAAIYVLCAASLAAVRLELPDPVPGRAVESPVLAGVLLLLSLAWLIAVVGTLVTLVVWNRATRRVAELYGADGNTYLRQWYSRVYGVSVIVTLALVWTESVSVRTLIIVGAAIRAIGGLVVIAGVLRGRARILGLIADSAGQTRAAQAPTPDYPAPRAEPIPDVLSADPWPAPGSHPPAP